jgi:hypothetical protein
VGVGTRAVLDRWRLTLIGVPITVLIAVVTAGLEGAVVSGLLVGIGTVVADTWIARDGAEGSDPDEQ